MTLEAWTAIWLEDYMFDKKWSTVNHYKYEVESHIVPALGRYQLSQLDPHRIQSFYNSLLRGNGGKNSLNPKSVRNVHGILSKCLSVAVKLEYLRRNPAEMVTLPRVERKEIRPLTDAQVSALLAVVGDDGYGTLIKVVLFTGLRLAEAIGLTWDCVDFEKRRLIISKQLQQRPLSEGGFTFTSLKNDRSRVIAPAPFVLDVLKTWRQRQAEERLKAGWEWKGWKNEQERQTSFVFTSEMGDHLYPQTTYLHFKKAAAQVGAPDARVHDLRHQNVKLKTKNIRMVWAILIFILILNL